MEPVGSKAPWKNLLIAKNKMSDPIYLAHSKIGTTIMALTIFPNVGLYLYNCERMGMIDKGVPGICLFQSNDIKAFLSNSGLASSSMHRSAKQCTRGCLTSSRPKVEAAILYSRKLARGQIYSMKIPKVWRYKYFLCFSCRLLNIAS